MSRTFTEAERYAVTVPLKVGDRFQLTAKGRRLLRPKSSHTGIIIGDRDDCWKVAYDGVRVGERKVHKSFIEREDVR